MSKSKSKRPRPGAGDVWDYQVHLLPADAQKTAWVRRACRLAPNGVPRWVRIYDNGGETIDRYTVVYTGRAAPLSVSAPGYGRRQFPYLAMSGAPFHPQGFGQHGYSDNQPADCQRHGSKVGELHGWPPAIGRRCHLGKRIEWADLPHDCKRAVWQDYAAIWDIPTPRGFTTAAGPTTEPRRVPAEHFGA